MPTVSFAAPHFGNDVSEGAGVLRHRLVLSAPSDERISVTVSGPGYRQGDLGVADRVVVFEPGQTAAVFRTRVYEDTIYEGDEVFKFEITEASGAEIDRSSSDAAAFYGYIIDNDEPMTTNTASSADFVI